MIVYLQMISEPAEKGKFESLYMKYRGMMYHVAFQILHNQADAEDAVHQAFLSILKNMGKIRQVDSPDTRAYVTIITERKAIDTIRDRKRVSLVEYEETMYGIAFEPPGDHGIGDAIAHLPAQYREVLLLRHAQGYSTREVAEILELNYDAARKLLYRAKLALKDQLEKEGMSV